ncbi:MAG: YoaK family protein [Ginsengibacter sp.]|jgi:uncharacterized membrane protein YoaK (UPF0700 family)
MKSKHSSIWFDIMLILLACVAGSIDVMSYYRLDHVFTANMTGNTILLGLSIGQGKLANSLHSLAALAGFITGAFIGAMIVENTKKAWSYYIILSLSFELLIIFILALIWFEESNPLDTTILYISILLSAIAMGMQSATVRHLNIPGVVTTFITGTITSIGMSAVKGLRNGFKRKIKDGSVQLPVAKNLEHRIELQILVFLAYGLTAVLTGWIEYHGDTLLPVLPLVLILFVIVIAIMRPENPHFSTATD